MSLKEVFSFNPKIERIRQKLDQDPQIFLGISEEGIGGGFSTVNGELEEIEGEGFLIHLAPNNDLASAEILNSFLTRLRGHFSLLEETGFSKAQHFYDQTGPESIELSFSDLVAEIISKPHIKTVNREAIKLRRKSILENLPVLDDLAVPYRDKIDIIVWRTRVLLEEFIKDDEFSEGE